MFELKDKVDGNVVKIYSVRSNGDRTEFLTFHNQYGFVWEDSSYYEPK